MSLFNGGHKELDGLDWHFDWRLPGYPYNRKEGDTMPTPPKVPAGTIPHCPFARPNFHDLMLSGRIVDKENSVVACTYGPGRCGALVLRQTFNDDLEPELVLWLTYRKPNGHTIAVVATGADTTTVAVKLHFAIADRLSEFHLSPMPESSKEKEK